MLEADSQKIIKDVRSQLSEVLELKSLEEIEIKTIEMRLNTVKESVQRNRFVFIVMTIACSAILFTLWNSNFARLRQMAFDREKTAEIAQGQPEPLSVYGRKLLVAEWYRSRSIQVNLLGIKVDVGDLSLVGSFALVVITLWYFYSQRQTNRTVIELLSYVDKYLTDKISVRKMVYQGIVQNAVFSKFDEPKEEVEPKSDETLGFLERKILKDTDRPIWGLNELQKTYYGEKTTNDRTSSQSFSDRVVRLLFYLPFWTIVAIISRDIFNLFVPSPISSSDNLMISNVISETQRGWNALISRDLTDLSGMYSLLFILIFDGFAVLCAVYTRILCNECFKFSGANNRTLTEFNKKTSELGSNTV